jgi:hypothetical protein
MNCPKCKREIEPGEATWPRSDYAAGNDICQDCWEDECSEAFWRSMGGEDELPEV